MPLEFWFALDHASFAPFEKCETRTHCRVPPAARAAGGLALFDRKVRVLVP
jgi:hypothetical protein